MHANNFCKKFIYISTTLFLLTTFALAEDSDERGSLAKALFSKEYSDKSGIDIRGWLSASGNWNPAKHDGGFNGPISFNDRADKIGLDQFYLITERKTSSEDWSLGGRLDLIYGTDSVFTTSRGFDDQINTAGSNNFYKLAIPQAYLEVSAPFGSGITIKAGHFYTLLGYEVVPAKDNLFLSHAYSMQYAEPFTHWGSLASYSVTDDLTLTAGIVRGWDNLSDSSDHNFSFLGGASYTINEDTSAIFSLISGNEGNNRNQTAYSMVVTHALSDSLSYIFQHDYGRVESGLGSSAAQWYSVNNYLIKQLCDSLSIGARLEWFRDDDGARVAGVRSGFGAASANYYQATFGANVKLNESLMFRPEIRYDYQDAIKGATGKGFNGGRDSDQIVSSANLILSF